MVSLTCSNTEIVAALGCADRLVGVDDHSDHPPEVVAKLPRVGPDLGVDPEKVKALEPDLVLASLTVPGHEKVVEAIAATGLPYLAPSPESLDDVYADIREIGRRLGVEGRAEEVAGALERGLESSVRGPGEAGPGVAVPDVAVPDLAVPDIAVQWWPKPVILPGRRSWVHDLIMRAGGRHPLMHEDVISRPVSDEELRQLAPDAIVLAWCGVDVAKYRPDVVYRNPAWKDVPAVRNRRVVSITEAWLGRPSPRLLDGYRALRHLVQSLS